MERRSLKKKSKETSIFHINPNSFTGPLIIKTFEKRAPGWLGTETLLLMELSFSLSTQTKINCQDAETEFAS